MSLSGSIWRLPGPRAYVEDIARQVSSGQHVLAVLPRYHYEDQARCDELAVALVERLDHGRRLQVWSSGAALIEAFGREVTLEDSPPVTVPDLLRHPDAAGSIFVCLVSDLEPAQQAALPDFLRRLEADSRIIPPDERCTFVLILDRTHLPQFAGGETNEVTMATSWYWNRVSRWDVAAHLAEHVRGDQAVLREVHQEVIIELARWNFDLAVAMAASWSGEPMELNGLASISSKADMLDPLPGFGASPIRPPDSVLHAWDDGLVDCWHDRICLAPTRGGVIEREGVARHLWSGQARVLLPWIELNRDALEKAIVSALGRPAYEQALRQFTRPEERVDPAGFAPEIALLSVIVRARLARQHPKMNAAAHALWRARNELAHLRPLTRNRLTELVRACEILIP